MPPLHMSLPHILNEARAFCMPLPCTEEHEWHRANAVHHPWAALLKIMVETPDACAVDKHRLPPCVYW